MTSDQPKITKVKLSDIRPDLANANRHTERGQSVTANSLQEFGFIDAGTLDKDNRIINGNSRTELSSSVLEADEAFIVEFEGRGTSPIFIKFNDLDLTTPEGRRAAITLNRSAQLSIDFDPEQIAIDMGEGVSLDGLFQDWEIDELMAGVGDVEWDGAFDSLPSEDRPPYQQMTFTLHDTQVKTVKNALSLVDKAEFDDVPNENSNGNALSFICERFIDGHG